MAGETCTFAEAIENSEPREGGRSVLLGNGFSIAWRKSIFDYRSLYQEATFKNLSVGKAELFEAFDTHDFETVIEKIRSSARLLELYEKAQAGLISTMVADAESVKFGLSEVLARRHPHNQTEVTDEESESARAFLSNFGRIFTLNYDLLLYWVVNRSDGSEYVVRHEDGFEWPTFDDRSSLVWKVSAADRGQRVFYLHGGLHLLVSGDQNIEKIAYKRSKPIIERVRGRLEHGLYPLVVTEGRSIEKVTRINQNPYLYYCHRRLQEATGSLFVHGVSMSQNDEHVFEKIEKKSSQVEALYVSYHGELDSDANDLLVQRCNRLARKRRDNGGRKLDLFFYDAPSAHVWS